MTPVAYGLRTTPDGFSFLLQPSGEQNLLVEGLKSGISLRSIAPRFCNHNVDLSDWVPAPPWISDPMVQAFLPLPGTGAYVIRNEDRRYDTLIRQLPRLSGATVAMIRPLGGSTASVRDIYEGTNLGPVVWLTMSLDQARSCAHHIELANLYQRRIVFIACAPLPFFQLITLTTELRDLGHEPLEKIGAGALRQIM